METNLEPKVKIDCKQGLIRAIRFDVDGNYAFTCGSDNNIKLWRPSKLLELNCYKGHSADVTDCQANPQSIQFLSCSNDKSIIQWEIETGKILRRFRITTPFNCVTYGGHQSCTTLAGSDDGKVRIYDLRSLNAWEPIQTLTEANNSITCVRSINNYIYTCSLDKGLRIYDVRKGSLTIDMLHTQLYHICLSEGGGETILISVVRGNPVLYDTKFVKILNEYKGNLNKQFKIESKFGLNDSMVISGSEDGKVYLWDIDSESESSPKIALLHYVNDTTDDEFNPNVIQSMASHSNGSLLTAFNNLLYLWDLRDVEK